MPPAHRPAASFASGALAKLRLYYIEIYLFHPTMIAIAAVQLRISLRLASTLPARRPITGGRKQLRVDERLQQRNLEISLEC